MTIDKNELYGQFQKSWDQRAKLTELATRKALDLPLDDELNITTTHQGTPFLTTALVSAVLIFGGGAAAITAASWLGWITPRNTLDASAQDFKVSIWAEDGEEIRLNPEKNLSQAEHSPREQQASSND